MLCKSLNFNWLIEYLPKYYLLYFPINYLMLPRNLLGLYTHKILNLTLNNTSDGRKLYTE